jgi:hypothetical protein
MILGKYGNMIDPPSIDKMLNHNAKGLIATPEGRLITAIFIQALEDLEFELKEKYPLETLDWFMSESPILHMACWLLEWNIHSLRDKIHTRLKTGSILNKKTDKKSKETNDENNP